MPRKEYLELAGDGVYRIVLGLLYKVVFINLCVPDITRSKQYWHSRLLNQIYVPSIPCICSSTLQAIV